MYLKPFLLATNLAVSAPGAPCSLTYQVLVITSADVTTVATSKRPAAAIHASNDAHPSLLLMTLFPPLDFRPVPGEVAVKDDLRLSFVLTPFCCSQLMIYLFTILKNITTKFRLCLFSALSRFSMEDSSTDTIIMLMTLPVVITSQCHLYDVACTSLTTKYRSARDLHALAYMWISHSLCLRR